MANDSVAVFNDVSRLLLFRETSTLMLIYPPSKPRQLTACRSVHEQRHCPPSHRTDLCVEQHFGCDRRWSWKRECHRLIPLIVSADDLGSRSGEQDELPTYML